MDLAFIKEGAGLLPLPQKCDHNSASGLPEAIPFLLFVSAPQHIQRNMQIQGGNYQCGHGKQHYDYISDNNFFHIKTSLLNMASLRPLQSHGWNPCFLDFKNNYNHYEVWRKGNCLQIAYIPYKSYNTKCNEILVKEQMYTFCTP